MNRLMFWRSLFTCKNLKKYAKNFINMPSALYICLENKGSVFTALEPYIEMNEHAKESLKKSVKCRRLPIDVEYLYQQNVAFQRLKVEMVSLYSDIENIKSALRKIETEKITHGFPDKKKMLENELQDALSKVKNLKIQYVKFEKTFVIPYLQLPNVIHNNTTDADEDIFALFQKRPFSPTIKSHAEIGNLRQELFFKNVSPSSYFLSGDLALLEMSLKDFFLDRLQERGFQAISSVDIVKSVLAEGCGYDIKDAGLLKISESSCLSYNLIPVLVGAASLPSFVAMFTKGLITFDESSTIRLVASGNKYAISSSSKPNSLYNTTQSTSVSSFVLSPKNIPDESLFTEIAMLITQIYTELGLHFKFIQYGASRLTLQESFAVGICLYSPYSDQYIEVGRISLYGDFISKRLQIFQQLDKRQVSFSNMMYVEVANVTKLVGCILENNQTSDTKFEVPECLKMYISQ